MEKWKIFYLWHGVTDPQREDVAEDVDLGVPAVELRGPVVPDEPVDDELWVLEYLEEIASKEAGHQAADVIPERLELRGVREEVGGVHISPEQEGDDAVLVLIIMITKWLSDHQIIKCDGTRLINY